MQPMNTPSAEGFRGVATDLLRGHPGIPGPRIVNMRIGRIVNPGGCGTHACCAGHYLLVHPAKYSGFMWNENRVSGHCEPIREPFTAVPGF